MFAKSKVLIALFALLLVSGCSMNKVNITSDALLSELKATYKELNSIHETSDIVMKHADGKSETYSSELYFSRPNLYKIVNKSPKAHFEIVCNGTLTSFAANGNKKAAIEPISLSIYTLYKRLVSKSLINSDIVTEYALLDGEYPDEFIKATTLKDRYENVDGVQCYVLELSYKNGDSQKLYVDAKTKLIRKNTILVSSPNSAPAATPLLTSSETMSLVERDLSFEDNLFKVDPVSGELHAAKNQTVQSANPLIGKAAPDFTLSDLLNNRLSLSKFKGSPVILIFWDPLYKPSIQQAAQLQKTITAENSSIKVLALSEENNMEKRKNGLKNAGVEFSSLYDVGGKVASIYNVDIVPYIILVDANGKVAQALPGNRDNSDLVKLLQ